MLDAITNPLERLNKEIERCQSALKFDPLSASNIDPLVLSRLGAA
ncbi:transposase [Roseovarius spongiae]|nr:transposase [Roseovarius spongiae]